MTGKIQSEDVVVLERERQSSKSSRVFVRIKEGRVFVFWLKRTGRCQEVNG